MDAVLNYFKFYNHNVQILSIVSTTGHLAAQCLPLIFDLEVQRATSAYNISFFDVALHCPAFQHPPPLQHLIF